MLQLAEALPPVSDAVSIIGLWPRFESSRAIRKRIWPRAGERQSVRPSSVLGVGAGAGGGLRREHREGKPLCVPPSIFREIFVVLAHLPGHSEPVLVDLTFNIGQALPTRQWSLPFGV